MKHTTHGDAHKVKGVEKGYVCNMDFIGPYPPDIDDNVWGMVNVECGTNYGQVALLHDKESTTALNSFKQQRALLKRERCKDIVYEYIMIVISPLTGSLKGIYRMVL